jgi:putative endonuclease
LRDGDVLVACEVKTRSSDAYGSPHEAIAADKLDRLQRLASRWAAERLSVTPPAIRIDLVAVRTGERGAAQVEHVRGLL